MIHRPEDSEAELRDAIGPRSPGPGTPTGRSTRYFIDLHCHTSASFDSLASPAAVVQAAAARGLTHIAITDHDRVDAALRARDEAPDGLTVIVGQELRTTAGDLTAAFIEQAIPPGLSPDEAIAAIHEQGGLVGLPHPFDRFRGSLLRDVAMASLAPLLDWVEVHNARVIGGGNALAVEFARAERLPGVAVSDAHTTIEVGVAYTVVDRDVSEPDALRDALTRAELVTGRASFVVRAVMPVAKAINRLRGNRRIRPMSASRIPTDRVAL